MILKASRIHGVESALVRAVIAVESAFNRYARSHKGALGLMQLMPATARRYGVVNAYDPWQNIRAGTEHLRRLINDFRDVRLALAAYNAGATAVKRYSGIPPYRETRNYVKKVMAIYRAGSKIQIVKGDRVYSIGQQGGQARVTKFHGQSIASAPPPARAHPRVLARSRGGTRRGELPQPIHLSSPTPKRPLKYSKHCKILPMPPITDTSTARAWCGSHVYAQRAFPTTCWSHEHLLIVPRMR